MAGQTISRPAARAEPLSRSLLLAAAAVQGVRAGRALDDALAQARQQSSNPGAVHDLAAHGVRHLALGQALLAQAAPRPPAEPANSLLCLALTLLAAAPDKYGEHTLVSQAVDAIAALPGGQRIRGFANAVLRGFLRERDGALARVMVDPACAYGHPAWWVDRLKA
ncbi:MAG TPA: 16S rRNA (cytosine(967)-C(5))-methyltransferase RsmB, partial [Burkholderiaceae bacterium]|nr:16S rRNA (cytosine(967)-C(5))-methyltransferase RsmB [Burkholderiaceae bacterium]